MVKSRRSLKSLRKISFESQKGLCYYCLQPMWNTKLQSYIKKHPITTRQALQLKCTGEHLKSHSEGGQGSKMNIVAACWFCNSRRHQRKVAISPKDFKDLVSKRLKQKRWHGFELII